MPRNFVELIRDPEAARDLRAYFAEDGPHRYTGRRFETLGGGGDRDATRDLITADDILAVQMLDVRVPGEVAIGLLHGDLGLHMTTLLSAVPTGVESGTAAAAPLIADGGPAEEAWRFLTKQDGVGWVIAGKLLARKRPGLVPVYDKVVACQLGRPKRFWVRMHNRLAAEQGLLRHELATARARAEVPAAVSLLRVLDVVLWMRHRRNHAKQACTEFNTFTLE